MNPMPDPAEQWLDTVWGFGREHPFTDADETPVESRRSDGSRWWTTHYRRVAGWLDDMGDQDPTDYARSLPRKQKQQLADEFQTELREGHMYTGRAAELWGSAKAELGARG